MRWPCSWRTVIVHQTVRDLVCKKVRYLKDPKGENANPQLRLIIVKPEHESATGSPCDCSCFWLRHRTGVTAGLVKAA